MSSHESPLRQETSGLLEHLAELARLQDSSRLQEALVMAAARLAECPLSQLYVLDHTGTSLTRVSAWNDGQLQPQSASSVPRNYLDEPLLQFCLGQEQTLSIPQLDNGVYQSGFLPDDGTAWRSLLCLPLRDTKPGLQGVLLVADRRSRELEPESTVLSHLGHFVISQLGLLQRLHPTRPSSPKRALAPVAGNYGLLGNSPCMHGVHQLISKVLAFPVSVLITGETGTGKELVARAIHDHGARASRSFIVQNCASLPENLLESELFGYRRGAFTGADSHHQGLFDAANGGTLFLDEIGDMQLPLQGKLLRVLQEGEVRPLGSNKTHKVDVRIIAATHHDLEHLVETGRFRRDLFYRLSCFPIPLPPLRERGADIGALAAHFADACCAAWQRPPCAWSQDALRLLDTYDFPGNVRELKALVERAVLLCEGDELQPCHLNPRLHRATSVQPQSLRERLEHHERRVLLDSLRRNRGNQSESARELDVTRRTFINRMERLGIKPAEHGFSQRKA
ncbi:sigma 54-interacting transcriptional regulator [Pseudomonas sp. 148P]|uniref:Sigma 54-interacting transcriptional regulator n=1 Tax=Pseudomonas ulcerans TaxID=3115852 RepID=A0ABU7HUV2_9PSED|nr:MULTISPECIES: sigma 54-interacting transcriptional regulator [unclassified Pseudomonas]MEE1924016.1 sigma 54-interacting transcriptional regulator [Pseudomonas sp. 147P]MEE1935221.1 sigma 54-interacting transcriptional regulator [Pseudomonas sp. 148P]